MSKIYLRIIDNNFGFYTDDVHIIKDTDIEINDHDYDEFFSLQSSGLQFRLKEITNRDNGLFGFVESFTPEVIPVAEIDVKAEIEKLKQTLYTLEQRVENS